MSKLLSLLCLTVAIVFTACGQETKIQEGLALKYLVQMPLTKQLHPPLIVILHGYGSDERDMFELAKVLPKSYVIVAARAPLALQGGGYQWFEKEMVNGKFSGRKESVARSRELVSTFIGQVAKRYNADAGTVFLMGSARALS